MNIEGIDSSWFWAAMGCIMLLVELSIGGVGFLLGAGAAALIMMLITMAFDLSWTIQWTLYTVLAIAITIVYWHFFNPSKIKTEDPLLNNPVGRLIGTKVKLITPLENGTGKVQISDAHWTVKADIDLPAGAVVEVVDHDGVMLIVKAG
ncbi:MAG: NfeD family protein [Cellvibrionaceae bacterium]|nr:NfeD family protein [Cellvibrionaceae bacterium]